MFGFENYSVIILADPETIEFEVLPVDRETTREDIIDELQSIIEDETYFYTVKNMFYWYDHLLSRTRFYGIDGKIDRKLIENYIHEVLPLEVWLKKWSSPLKKI